MISEYTSSWQQLTDNVSSMLDVLKDVRDTLEDGYDRDDDDDDRDNTRYGGGKDGSPGTPGRGEYVNSGPGVYADGIKKGAVGGSGDERLKMLQHLATKDLKNGEVPIIAHEGEAVLNKEQQEQLLDNVDKSSDSNIPELIKHRGKLEFDPDDYQLLRNNDSPLTDEVQEKLWDNVKNSYSIGPKFPDYSHLIQFDVKPAEYNLSYSTGDITVGDTGELEREFMKGAKIFSNSLQQKMHKVHK